MDDIHAGPGAQPGAAAGPGPAAAGPGAAPAHQLARAALNTPANATFTVAAVSTVLAAVVGYGLGSENLGGAPTTIYFFFATLGTLAVIVVYITLCAGGMVFFRRTRSRYNPLLHAVIPLVGVLIFGAALYGSIYPTPPAPLDLTPYIVLAWLIAGAGAVLYLRARHPEAVERIGSILGEEGGEDAAELDRGGEGSVRPAPGPAVD